MVSVQTASTGKRIYRGASQSPNKGQVSAKGAQGYLKRELNNKRKFNQQRLAGKTLANPKGKDGKSDSRSGVAAMALKRRNNGGRNAPADIRFAGGVKGGRKRPPKGYTGPEGRRPSTTSTTTVSETPTGSTTSTTTEEPEVPQAPTVVVNDEGLLELPYNNQFAEEQYAALEEANRELLDMNSEAQQQALEFSRNKRDAELAYKNLQGQTLNENAGAGTVFSSRYGTGVAQGATAYSNMLGDLNLENQNFLNTQSTQRNAIQAALNSQLGRSVLNLGNELSEDAGNLGYGQAKGKVNKNQPKIKAGGNGKRNGKRNNNKNKDRRRAASKALQKAVNRNRRNRKNRKNK